MQSIDDILEQIARGQTGVEGAVRKLEQLEREHGVRLERVAAPPELERVMAPPELERVAAPPEPARPSAHSPAPAQPPQKESPAALVSRFELALRERVGKILSIEPAEVATDVRFMDLGLDSAAIIRLSSELEAELETELYPTLLFEHEHVAALCKYLIETYPAAVQRVLGAPSPAAEALPVAPVHEPAPVAPLRAAAPEEAPAARHEILSAPSSSLPSCALPSCAAPRRAPVLDDELEIAVIGYSCRFPGAPDTSSFWRLLSLGRSGISEVPGDRFDWRKHYGPDADPECVIASNQGGFVAGIYGFDTSFFGISRREAELMDPQQRLLLQTVWHAIEDAGYAASALARNVTGLFVGASTMDWVEVLESAGVRNEAHFGTGIAHALVANRISFLLDLKGPSEAIDTACSSSLVALHRAVQALKGGECDVALVGGVNAMLTPRLFNAFSKAGMLSPDGLCRTFGEGANGYVRGEGAGAVVLKPLKQALADGDAVRAVIRASAVAHGGRTNSLTAPSVNSQVALLKRVYREGGIDPETVSYVEAHGTGTKLGDPIEIEALKKILPPASGAYCGVGSVKTNVGHLEAAAGMAGLIKVLLALEHEVLPASLHAERPNPLCNLEGSALFLVQSTGEWRNAPRAVAARTPRRAGVSSFGFGGTNAHVVLEQFPARRSTGGEASGDQLLLLSAKTPGALAGHAERLHAWLAEGSVGRTTRLSDVAYTLAVGREPMPERLAIVVRDREQLLERLAAFARNSGASEGVCHGRLERGEAERALLDDGAEASAYIDALFASSKLERLARLWVSGAPVHESKAFHGTRVALPGYAFSEEVYRVAPSAAPSRPIEPMRAPEPVPRALEATPPIAPTRSPEQRARDVVCGVVAKVLGFQPEALDVDAPHGELGVDSVLGVEVINRLNETLGTSLKTSDLFSYSTVRKLGAHIAAAFPECVPNAPAQPIEPLKVAAASVMPVPTVPAEDRGVEPQATSARAESSGGPIAIVGIAGQFPDAPDVESFWENLKRGHCAVREVPEQRWSNADYYDADPHTPGKTACRFGAFMSDVEHFDPLFFGITPKEAELMDPQQRLFLEQAYRALEDAGCSERWLAGRKVGVFVGATPGDYRLQLYEAGVATDAHTFMGNAGSILAARLSYAMNLNGPALIVDTACSASLVAIHLAFQSLRAGDCDVALAGGVCVLSSPEFHVFGTKAGMLSSGGLCRTFDQGADGMVPGEAVGVLVLKRLERALADGDRVYAVIRGSGMNQDGRTNGITAPSATAQTTLELEVYASHDIDPSTIGYVEAHGTGTKLGDPIEVDALSEAFKRYTDRAGYCALGSVKTNVGHTLTAAGVVSVIKAALCLRDGVIPPLLHYQRTNEHIKLEGSPFYVNTERRALEAVGGARVRRAAVSSFGFSGTNCHMVLEEVKPRRGSVVADRPQLVTVSAKDPEALRQLARRLSDWVERYGGTETLADVAYTLNQRRTHFPHRLACVAESLPDLGLKLRRFADHGEREELVSGVAADDSGLEASEEFERLSRALSAPSVSAPELREHGFELARRYVSGSGVNLAALAPVTGRVVSLPGHPMNRRPCWLGSNRGLSGLFGQGAGLRVHPLLDRVQPALDGARFSKHFGADEPWIRHHRVRGRVVVPGVAYLEMVRAAAVATLGGGTGARVRIRDVAWLSPCVVPSDGANLCVSLRSASVGCEFQITRLAPDSGRETLLVRGKVEIAVEGDGPVRTLDIASFRAAASEADRSALYARMARRGLEYGPEFQAITRVSRQASAVLAELSLNAEQRRRAQALVLHPSLFDGALQAVAALIDDEAWPHDRLILPYAVDEVVIDGRIPERAYAYAEPVEIDAVQGRYRFNVALLDEAGRVVVRVSGLALVRAQPELSEPARPELPEPARREFAQPPERLPSASPDLFYAPTWRALPLESARREPDAGRVLIVAARRDRIADALAASYGGHRVLRLDLGESFDRSAERIEIDVRCATDFDRVAAELASAHTVYFLAPDLDAGDALDSAALERAEETGVLALFRLIKSWDQHAGDALRGQLLVVTRSVHHVEPEDRHTLRPAHAALSGLARVAANEIDGLSVHVIDVCDERSYPGGESGLAAALRAEAGDGAGSEIALRRGGRYSLRTQRMPAISAGPSPLRRGGTYLIAGGASGIGLELSVWLAKNFSANVALLGRSPRDGRGRKAEQRIELAGGSALYVECDIGDAVAVRAAVEQVRRRFGAIHGAVHSALVLRDRRLRRMSEADFVSALYPKTRGAVALAAALAGESLDFFVFFSSINSVVANAGQANYVAGCTFKDAFARTLRHRYGVNAQVLNWGYWGEIGVVATPEYREALAERGLLSLDTQEGIAAFERVLATRTDQVYVVKLNAGASSLIRLEEGASSAKPGVLSALQEQLVRVGAERGAAIEGFLRQFQELDQVCGLSLLATALSIGLLPAPGQSTTLAETSRALGLLPKYERLLEALLGVLETRGWLRRSGEVLSLDEGAVARVRSELDQLPARCERVRATCPDVRSHLALLERCLPAYAGVLAGRTPATDVLFPGATMSLVSGIYSGNALSDHFNALVAQSVVELAARSPGAGEFKVLELGAGTGGTSAVVLDRIASSGLPIAFTYTDISPSFVQYGRKTFGSGHSRLDFRVLDVERPPDSQGFACASFDVVFATNCVHATRDVSRSLAHARQLLKPGGILILNEFTGVRDVMTLTFGLLEGWWLYEDRELRLPRSPLLGMEQWGEALRRAGFSALTSVVGGRTPADERESFQRLILATAPAEVLAPALARAEFLPALTTDRAGADTGSARASVQPPAARSGTDVADVRAEALADVIADVIAGVVGVEARELGRDLPFSDLGVDSIIAVDIVQRVSAALGIELKTSDLFSYSNMNALARYALELGAAPAVAAPLAGQQGSLFAATAPVTSSELAPDASARSVPSFSTQAPMNEVSPALAEAAVTSWTSSTRDAELGPIAIVGMSGMFPGAGSPAELWSNVLAGRCSVSEVPPARWSAADLYDPNPQTPGKSVSRWGGFMDHATEFDPLFFNISPKEAELMDPQHRLFLQESYKALQDAGYRESELAESNVGVFVGATSGDYVQRLREAGRSLDAHVFTGNAASILAARIAYHLNLKGPAVTVDTACSSSLLAIHMGIEALRSGRCEMVLAGGVSVLTTPEFHVFASKAGMLSPRGLCRTFDQGADGMVPGEAVGVLVLKRLDRALADGDRVYALIRESGTNQDGRTNGITAPSAAAQTALELDVYARSGIDPSTIGYVEAHGTGTKLGDPVEVDALSAAFRRYTKEVGYCALGSVKTNVGHTLTAAGVVSVIKAALSLRDGVVAPVLHYGTANEHIQLEGSPFYVNTEPRALEAVGGARVRRAAVSSFGFSGTNCHLVLEEAEPRAEQQPTASAQLVTLSAKDAEPLREHARRIAEFLEQNQGREQLANVAYTLNQRRTHFSHRLALVVQDLEELAVKLRTFAETGEPGEVLLGSGSEPPRASRRALRETAETLMRALVASPETDRAGRLSALAWMFVQGHELDFGPLFEGSGARVTSLPGYSFRAEHYFVESAADSRDRAPAAERARPEPVSTDVPALLTERWEPLPVGTADSTWAEGSLAVLVRDDQVPSLREALGGEPSGRWVVIATSDGPSGKEADRTATLVEPGDGRLLACDLLAAYPDLTSVVDLSDAGLESSEVAVDYARTAFFQELLKQQPARSWSFLHFTAGLRPFEGEAPSLSGAWFAGLLPVLDAEYRRVRARSVDVAPGTSLSELWRTAERELRDANAPSVLAVRGGTRFTRRLRPLLSGAELGSGRTLALHGDATYLVTGATGELGFEVCRLLIARGARRLGLLGVRGLPERSPGQTTEPADPLVSAKLARVAELERLGAEVLVHRGDLRNNEGLAAFIAGVRAETPIRGIVHCAANVDYRHPSFLAKSVEELPNVVAPKLAPVASFESCLDRDALDFCVFFSSISGAIAELGVGVAEYAAANACLDALALHRRRSSGCKVVSLRWTDWNQTRMGSHATRRTREAGFAGHDTAQGLLLLEAALLCDEPVLVPCVCRSTELAEAPATPASAVRALAPRAELGQDAPASQLAQNKLRELFARELKLPADRLELDTPFGEWGVDSIVVAELVHKLEPELGAPLDPAAIFEHPTLRRLADFVVELHPAAINRWRQQGAPATFAGAPSVTPVAPSVTPVAPSVTPVAPSVTPAAVSAPLPSVARHPIAIIGVACEFPGAQDRHQFFENLCSGVCSVREVPASRWDVARFYDPEPKPSRSYGKWGGFLADIESFDPGYFGIAEAEAADIDPLERKFLMTAAQSLRDAGYEREELAGARVGVFVGARSGNYADKLGRLRKNTIVGIGQNFIAAYASHVFNFRGPNLVVDTACSSSLVSVHLACQSLSLGECELALAGGVDVLLDERPFLLLSEAKALSPDGKCHVFDIAANGFVPGEGCGVVLLKRLDRALADGDRVYAVIEGSAVNNDGATMGVTTPNIDGQKDVVRSALAIAGVPARSIEYVEAHGTGTMIGDPIELKALTEVYREHTPAAQFCAIGSVKSNFGHLLSAAGIAGLIKAALCVHHAKLVPTLHCETPNNRFKFAESPFYPSLEGRDWKGESSLRRAAVSAFGFGGTNCHVVLSNAGLSAANATRAPLAPVAFRLRRYWPEAPARKSEEQAAAPRKSEEKAASSRKPMLFLREHPISSDGNGHGHGKIGHSKNGGNGRSTNGTGFVE